MALAVSTVPIGTALGVPFTLQGPGVQPDEFRVTTFATGLNFPNGMASLPDGSLLVGVSNPNPGGGLYDSTGELLRFVDANHDGVADGPGQVMYTFSLGTLTSVQRSGDLTFVTLSQGLNPQIDVLRDGATPGAPLSLVASLDLAFPNPWPYHVTYGSAVEATSGGNFKLFFNVGSQQNNVATTETVALSGTGLSGTTQLNSAAIYQIDVHEAGGTVSFSDPLQVASGVRNAAGMTIDPATGDLIFDDNGEDGVLDPTMPINADELNRIPAAELGVSVPDFGFPDNYIVYGTGVQVGGDTQPIVAFQPQGGFQSVGANDAVLAPAQFPNGLNDGVFVGFHGTFDGGNPNLKNSLVYYDFATQQYFHFIEAGTPGVGHLDGLLPTSNSLFVSDLTSSGNVFGRGGDGVIYEIQSLVTPVPEPDSLGLAAAALALSLLNAAAPARYPSPQAARLDRRRTDRRNAGRRPSMLEACGSPGSRSQRPGRPPTDGLPGGRCFAKIGNSPPGG